MNKWTARTHLAILLILAVASGLAWTYRDWQSKQFLRAHPDCSLAGDDYKTQIPGREIEFQLRSAEHMDCLGGFGRFQNIRITVSPSSLPGPTSRIISEDKRSWGYSIRAVTIPETHIATLGWRFPKEWAGKTGTITVDYDLTYPTNDSVSADPYSQQYVNLTDTGTEEFCVHIYGKEDVSAVSLHKAIDRTTTCAGAFLMMACGGYTLLLFLQLVITTSPRVR